eukprot:14696845-Alexandrium_andersonii.AAC.1
MPPGARRSALPGAHSKARPATPSGSDAPQEPSAVVRHFHWGSTIIRLPRRIATLLERYWQNGPDEGSFYWQHPNAGADWTF